MRAVKYYEKNIFTQEKLLWERILDIKYRLILLCRLYDRETLHRSPAGAQILALPIKSAVLALQVALLGT